MTPSTWTGIRHEASTLAREVRRLASRCASLTWELDRGLPPTGTDDDLHGLCLARDDVSRRFDTFMAENAHPEWRAHLQQIHAGLQGLVTIDRGASALLADWQRAAAGTPPPGFAGAFLEGVEMVDENYRLLIKSGKLPAGFPRAERPT